MNKNIKDILESVSEDTLLKKIYEPINEDINIHEKLRKQEFRAKVKYDVIYTVEKTMHAYSKALEIHPQRALRLEDSGDVMIPFNRAKQHFGNNLKELEKLTRAFEAEMGLFKVQEPWATVAGKANKKGEHSQVWNQVMIKPIKQDYRNIPGSLGHDFTLEISVSNTSITVLIKFSGRAN